MLRERRIRELKKIDKSFIGRRRPPTRVRVEAAQLRMFLGSIGENGPIFRDAKVAMAAGFRGIPIPATYLFCLHMLSAEEPYQFYREIGIEVGRLLHGEQNFTYHSQVCVGDVLSFQAEIADVVDKKGGAMTLVTQRVRVENQDDQHVADMILNTLVLNTVSEDAA
jgi:acyl dehydratase